MPRIAALALASVALAAAADVTGNWNLTATAPGGDEHRAQLELKNEGGRLSGMLTGPEGAIALEDVRLAGDQLSWRLPVQGGFVLKLTVAANSMKGTYTGADGTSGPVAVTRAAAAAGASVAGQWKGTAKSSGGRLYHIVLDVASQDGKITGTLSADEGSLPIQDARLEADRFSFKLTTDDGEYTIKLTVSANQMKGTYAGPGGESGSVELSR